MIPTASSSRSRKRPQADSSTQLSQDSVCKKATCALCGGSSPLKESHVISKYLWKLSGLIGHQKKFEATCLNDGRLSLKHQQDGFKEYLLCENCEQRRAKVEDISRRSLFGKIRNLNFQGNSAIISGLDYKSLKLNSMYQLWMMGVSEHPFYANVYLGPHLTRLGELLLNDDPGEPWQYGTTVSSLGGNDPNYTGIFSQPEKTRIFNHNLYRYVIAGFHHFTYVTSHPPAAGFQKLFLQKDGSVPIFRSNFRDYPDLVRKFLAAQS